VFKLGNYELFIKVFLLLDFLKLRLRGLFFLSGFHHLLNGKPLLGLVVL
jgi:hypothetical protein